MKTSTIVNKYLISISSIALIFLLWLIVSLCKNNEFIFPTWSSIFTACGDILSSWDSIKTILYSFMRILIVLILSFISAIIISFLYVIKNETYIFFRPFLAIMKASPLAIISIYIWLTVGSQYGPYYITYLMVMPIFTEAMVSSIISINKSYIYELKMTNVSITKKFFKIYLPLIQPYILMTFLQCFGMSIKVMMMAEYICQTKNSVGKMIYDYKSAIELNYLLAILLIIVLIDLLFEFFMNKYQKRIQLNK